MLNSIVIQGRLGKDPELHTTQSGLQSTRFTVACDRDYTNAAGQREADWFDVMAWRQTASFICNHFAKGDTILLQGRLQARTYDAQDGSKRKAVEIVTDHVWFAGSKRETAQATAGTSAAAPGEFTEVDDDDDMPF